MDARLYVGNLSRATTQEELDVLFTQAGVVSARVVIKDRKTGESRGFAFVTMSVQDEADKAISMFHAYTLDGNELKASMARTREQHIATHTIIEP